MWKAYGIGKGKLIRNQKLKEMAKEQGKTGLVVHEDFSNPIADTGVFKKPETRKCGPQGGDKTENVLDTDCQAPKPGFPCPEVGCVKVFVSSNTLEKHLDAGKHFYYIHKEGSCDEIKCKWESRCIDVGSVRELTCKTTDLTDQERGVLPAAISISEKGWAKKKAKAAVRFSPPVKAFPNDLFFKGEETGQKANPADVSSQLRSVRNPDGVKMFKKSEWLTAQQVTSYFSRLSVLYRSGRFSRDAEDKDVEEIAMLEEALSRQKMNKNITSNLEL